MIAVLDYGSGNIKAFLNAYERMGIACRTARSAEELTGADRIILPGVGAFDTAMGQFRDSGLRPVVEEMVFQRQVPLLGICVGMQMLADRSEEGSGPGLGWIAGDVRRLGPADLRLPHMGWNRIQAKKDEKLLANLPNGGRVYFLHSYYFEARKQDCVIATAAYGARFSCAIRQGAVYGIQFHPEKSHDDGLQILRNFTTI